MSLEKHQQASSISQLAQYYRNTNLKEELFIGIEWERSGVYRDTLQAVKYKGEKGYLEIFQKLVDEAGWTIMDQDDYGIYELKRGETRITLEPDGRPELSGSPKSNLHDLAREFRIHCREVEAISDDFNIGWFPLGFQPLHSNKELKRIDKTRYKTYDKLFQNDHVHSMMLRNNGLTTNFSFTDEENAIKKTQTAIRLIPILGAMFSSSALSEGQSNLCLSNRRAHLFKFAPERTKLPSNILDSDFSYEKWIKYYFNIPVILIKKKGEKEVTPDSPLTFRQWLENGYKGIYPSIYSFDEHVRTTWSDLRLRPSYLEYRIADSVPFRFALSIPALIKGLLLDSNSWEEVYNLTHDWTFEDIIKYDQQSWTTGLQTEIKGKKLLEYAKEVINISDKALHKFDHTKDSKDGIKDESIYLEPIKQQILIKEKSLSEEIKESWEGKWHQNGHHLLDWCEQENF